MSITPDLSSIPSRFYLSICPNQSALTAFPFVPRPLPSLARPLSSGKRIASPRTLHFLFLQPFGLWQGLDGQAQRKASDLAHGCQEGVWRWSTVKYTVLRWRTSSLSQGQTDMAACARVNTHAQNHQSLAYRKRYHREKNWIRKYGYCDLWGNQFWGWERNTTRSALYLKTWAKAKKHLCCLSKAPPSCYSGLIWNIHTHVWQDHAHYVDLFAGLH